MPKFSRCRHFTNEGKQISHCRFNQTNTGPCRWAHPEDPEWANASPDNFFTRNEFPRSTSSKQPPPSIHASINDNDDDRPFKRPRLNAPPIVTSTAIPLTSPVEPRDTAKSASGWGSGGCNNENKPTLGDGSSSASSSKVDTWGPGENNGWGTTTWGEDAATSTSELDKWDFPSEKPPVPAPSWSSTIPTSIPSASTTRGNNSAPTSASNADKWNSESSKKLTISTSSWTSSTQAAIPAPKAKGLTIPWGKSPVDARPPVIPSPVRKTSTSWLDQNLNGQDIPVVSRSLQITNALLSPESRYKPPPTPVVSVGPARQGSVSSRSNANTSINPPENISARRELWKSRIRNIIRAVHSAISKQTSHTDYQTWRRTQVSERFLVSKDHAASILNKRQASLTKRIEDRDHYSKEAINQLSYGPLNQLDWTKEEHERYATIMRGTDVKNYLRVMESWAQSVALYVQSSDDGKTESGAPDSTMKTLLAEGDILEQRLDDLQNMFDESDQPQLELLASVQDKVEAALLAWRAERVSGQSVVEYTRQARELKEEMDTRDEPIRSFRKSLEQQVVVGTALDEELSGLVAEADKLKSNDETVKKMMADLDFRLLQEQQKSDECSKLLKSILARSSIPASTVSELPQSLKKDTDNLLKKHIDSCLQAKSFNPILDQMNAAFEKEEETINTLLWVDLQPAWMLIEWAAGSTPDE